MSAALSPEAQAYGRRAAEKLLRGRKGHGGGPCMRRTLTEAELAVVCASAFQAGRLGSVEQLADLALSLTPSGEIGDGMVARFHQLARQVKGDRS